jgi:hypothetical protein
MQIFEIDAVVAELCLAKTVMVTIDGDGSRHDAYSCATAMPDAKRREGVLEMKHPHTWSIDAQSYLD